MIDSSYPNTKDFQESRQLRRNALIWLMMAVVLIVVGTMTACAYLLPQTDPTRIVMGGIALIVCLTLPVVLCFYPRVGLYILFGAALLFPGGSTTPIVTMPTSYVPFWWNWSTIGDTILGTKAIAGVVFSPAEMIMVLTFCIWLVRAIALRQFALKIGTFFWPISAYIAMVGFGFVTGIAKGGNITMALYEVRGQAYFFMVYLMAVNMFTERRQIIGLVWTAVICNGIQGITGTITYFSMHGTITSEGFMAHEESLLLNLIFFIAMFAAVLRLDKRLIWVSVLLIPTTLMAILGNQRRASIAAFIIAFLPVTPILWVILKEQRKNLGIFAAIFAVCCAIYLPAAWNSEGAWALPARAIRSQNDPNARDAASNWYRADEEFDVKATRDTSPWFGVGYGSMFLQPRPLPSVTTDFVHYMPHNSILWVWMRLGHVGFFLFWFMVATILIRGLETIKKVKSPEARLVGLLALMMLMLMITFGKYDLALVESRILTVTAILVGSLAILPDMEPKPQKRQEAMDGEEFDEESVDLLPAGTGSAGIPF